ncbi:MAG: hypothetical protein WCH76_04005, partial [Candidatus Riflemargulisbacteria bacterium]
MKKKILFFILSIYLIFIVSIPLIYFFFYGPTQDYRCSVAFDTKNNSFFLIGDSFVLEKVLLNDKEMSWQKKDNVYRSVNTNFSANKLYRLYLRDKQDNFIDFQFRFPQASILDNQILDFSCKTSVVDPTVTINKENLPFFDGEINTDYVFSEKTGDVINIKNIVIDFQYQTESAKLSYGKFFIGLFGETIRYSKISWHFFIEFNKYVFKISSAFFKFSKENIKPVGGLIARGSTSLYNVAYSGDNSLFKSGMVFSDIVEKRLSVVTEHFLKIFKNNYIYMFVNDIGGNSGNLVGTVQSNTSDVFRGVNNFFQQTVVTERVEKQKRKEIVVRNMLTSKIYKVASKLDGVEFLFVNGLGEPLVNERVKVDFSSKVKNNALLLSPMTVYTDNKGAIKVNLKFGYKVSEHEINIQVRGKRFVYDFLTEPELPFVLKDITNRPMLFKKAGALVKNAFVVKVYDQYNNIVPNAKVQLLEQDIEEQNQPFVVAEVKSDNNGKAGFAYRMNDNSGRVLMLAKLPSANGQFVYTVQSESTKPIEILALSPEEVEGIIGIPLKAPFKVKVLDDNGNPCPNIPIEFSFQNSTFEELEAKKVRTDKNGVAVVAFRTPAVVGYFQVVASSPKVPEYETSFVVLVMPGNAAKMIISTGNRQTVEWEKNSEPLVIQVLDDKGNPIPNTAVKWSSQKNITFVDSDETTDLDGFARAVVKTGETQNKENNIVVQVGKVKDSFKIFPKQPSFYKLDLVSNPVVNVFTAQIMAEPIEFVLRDQYGSVLPDQEIHIEYIVFKRGVQYLQNYTLVTDKAGLVSFNFVVSDQKDVINLKGKYLVDSKPRITWVKINVIPEEISNIVVPDNIVGVVDTKLNKPIQIFVADNNAAPVVDIFLSVKLKRVPPGAKFGKDAEQSYQLKTNAQGMCEFNPVLGNLKGVYVYTAKINTLEKDIIIKAVPDLPSRIRLVANNSPKFSVFKQVNSLSAQVFDKYDNLITNGTLVYDINTSKKVLRHDFNKKVAINEKGLTNLPFQAPEKKGTYYIYVTDGNYNNSVFYQFEVVESAVSSLVLLSSEDKDKNYVVGKQYKTVFKTRVIDRYGNFVEKTKLSVDLYADGSSVSSVGTDAFTDASGIAGFDIVMPEKAGRYNLVIYSDADETIRQSVPIIVRPESIYSSVILSGNNQIINPGLKFVNDFSIRLTDRYDNALVNEQIRWSYALDVKGETRQYIQTEKTNGYGISTFNFVTDRNPGVKEVKAYYKKDNKWQYLSFYVKVLGLSVESLKKIAGDSQSVLIGKEVPDFYVIKALDLHGNPVQDMPIIFRMISDEKDLKGAVILEKMSRTDNNGIVKQKFSAPVASGNYKVVVFPQFQEKLKISFDLNVGSEKIKPKAGELKKNEQQLLRLISVESDKIVVKVGDNSRLCEVMLVDRLNNPIPGVVIEWEIYEVAKNVTFTRTTRTDSEGKTSLPEVNRSFERKFVVKAVEASSRSSVMFNLDIVKDLASEVSLNYIGLPMDDNSPPVKVKEESAVADDALNVLGDGMIVINDGKIDIKRSNQLDLFVGQAPYVLRIYNNKDRAVVGDIRIGKRRIKNNFVIEPKNVLEISLTSDVTQNVEEIRISVAKNRMLPWIKDSGSFKLVTNAGALYEANHVDRLFRSLFVGQLDLFVFSINPKVAMTVQKKEIALDISVIPKTGKKVSFTKTVEVNKEFVFENLFEVPGEYKVVISSYLLANKLEYVVKVFDGDNLLKPLSGFGEYISEADGVTIPLSLEVIYRITREKVVNDF